MAIENLKQANEGLAVISQQNLFQQNNTIVAGTIKVKHPLMDETPLLVIGFVIEDSYFNQEDFKIVGDKIKYRIDGSKSYASYNDLIYPKIIIDYKKTHCSLFFKDKTLVYRGERGPEEAYLSNGKYYWNEEGTGTESNLETIYNYYYFSLVASNIPECCSNSIFAVCKYREEGTFKHAIFNLHEIIPVVV